MKQLFHAGLALMLGACVAPSHPRQVTAAEFESLYSQRRLIWDHWYYQGRYNRAHWLHHFVVPPTGSVARHTEAVFVPANQLPDTFPEKPQPALENPGSDQALQKLHPLRGTDGR